MNAGGISHTLPVSYWMEFMRVEKCVFFPKLLIMSNALWDALPLGPYNIPEHSVPKVGVSMFFVMRLVHGTFFTFLIDSSAKYDL